MSKIKTNRLEPRATNGSLTIGNPESYTTFEGDVQIPGYATEEYVQDLVTGDLDVELVAYQRRDEKDVAGGYAGLDNGGRISASRLDTDQIEEDINTNTADIAINAIKIENLESEAVFQIDYFIGNKDGTDPTDSYLSLNAVDWESATQIKISKIDAIGAIHDFSTISIGDVIWFQEDVGARAGGSLGLYTIGSTAVAANGMATFGVSAQSAVGVPEVGDRVHARVFPSVDIDSKADIAYVDAQDNWIKDNYLPLFGGTNHKMTADLYMASNTIKGLSPDRTNSADAVSYTAADREYVRQDGTSGLPVVSENLDMDSHDIENVSGIGMNAGAVINWDSGDPGGQLAYGGETKIGIGLANVNIKTDITMNAKDIKDVGGILLEPGGSVDVKSGSTGKLQYDGADKFHWGANVSSYAELNMRENKVTNLGTPTTSDDAATKGYVDELVPTPLSPAGTMSYVFTSAGIPSGSYEIGNLFFTTEGNVAYTTNFDNTRYVCFSYRDRYNKFWHFANQSGSFAAPACNIYLIYDGHTMGAFEYDGSTLGAYSGNITGNLVVPVVGWTSCSPATGATATAGYRLRCEWFA